MMLSGSYVLPKGVRHVDNSNSRSYLGIVICSSLNASSIIALSYCCIFLSSNCLFVLCIPYSFNFRLRSKSFYQVYFYLFTWYNNKTPWKCWKVIFTWIELRPFFIFSNGRNRMLTSNLLFHILRPYRCA